MAALVDYAEDIEIHTSSDGTEIVREKGISAGSVTEIIQGNLIPGYGTRHPVFNNFRLMSGSITRTGNDKGKWQGFWRGTYSSKTTLNMSHIETDPWELGAHEYSVEPFPIEIPMVGGYTEDGEYKRLLNTAGCILQRQQTIYGYAHKFIYCIKDTNGKQPTFAAMAMVNSTSCQIAGEYFEEFTSLLLPPSVNYRVEYNDNGNVKRKYWEIAVEIRVHPISWQTETLNVGTMAKFADKDGNINDTPEQIFQYTPWVGGKEEDKEGNFKMKPVYGSIRDVVQAKHNYAIAESGGIKNDKYYNAYKELPWAEVTEPLPLRLDGTVYTEAMEDPENNEYYVIALYDAELGDFGMYGFPKKREG